jgi:hypothetical protein
LRCKRIGLQVLVGRRVDQKLEAKRRPASIARVQRDHRGEVAAGAVATNRNAVAMNLQCL